MDVFSCSDEGHTDRLYPGSSPVGVIPGGKGGDIESLFVIPKELTSVTPLPPRDVTGPGLSIYIYIYIICISTGLRPTAALGAFKPGGSRMCLFRFAGYPPRGTESYF